MGIVNPVAKIIPNHIVLFDTEIAKNVVNIDLIPFASAGF